MPELARFFGIIIFMYWRDHNPPHFHAVYGDHEALVSLEGEILAGTLPRRALSMVYEWLAPPWRAGGELAKGAAARTPQPH